LSFSLSGKVSSKKEKRKKKKEKRKKKIRLAYLRVSFDVSA
jgi:hypothetical protein